MQTFEHKFTVTSKKLIEKVELICLLSLWNGAIVFHRTKETRIECHPNQFNYIRFIVDVYTSVVGCVPILLHIDNRWQFVFGFIVCLLFKLLFKSILMNSTFYSIHFMDLYHEDGANIVISSDLCVCVWANEDYSQKLHLKLLTLLCCCSF